MGQFEFRLLLSRSRKFKPTHYLMQGEIRGQHLCIPGCELSSVVVGYAAAESGRNDFPAHAAGWVCVRRKGRHREARDGMEGGT
jgi:hypothetical protein